MSIRDALLALLTIAPSNGYALKQELRACAAGQVDLNDGQVYTALARLQRDHLVARCAQSGSASSAYSATDAGRRAAAEWFRTAWVRDRRPDDLALKVTFCERSHYDVVAMLERAHADMTATSHEPLGALEWSGDESLAAQIS